MITSRPQVVGKKVIGTTTILEYERLSTGELQNPRVIKSYNFHPDIIKRQAKPKRVFETEVEEEVRYL